MIYKGRIYTGYNKDLLQDLILGLKELCVNRIFPQTILTRGKR